MMQVYCSSNTRRLLQDIMYISERSWRRQNYLYTTVSCFCNSSWVFSSFSSTNFPTSRSLSPCEVRNRAAERHYRGDTSQNLFIEEFVEESRKSVNQLSSSSLVKFATKLRTNVDLVHPNDVAKILNQVRNTGYRFGKFQLRSSEGTTQLLQEVNNIIYKQLFHEEANRRQQAYSHIFDIIHALRNVCATHPEIRNIMGTLTKAVNKIESNKSIYDIDSTENIRVKLAFNGLMHKDGYLDHVQGALSCVYIFGLDILANVYPFNE